MQSSDPDAVRRQISDLANHLGVDLFVLDDAWNGAAVDAVLHLLPASIPVLVTSRSRFPVLRTINVQMLERSASLDLLSHHARTDWTASEDANRLCRVVGDLPFAIRIAGEIMGLDGLHPGELLADLAEAPHAVRMPSGFEEHRPSASALLQTSLQALNDPARNTFMTFGRLYARGSTSTLLSLVMGREESDVRESLRLLQRRGLAEREGEADPKLAYYSIHDLAYSYARSEQEGGLRNNHVVLAGCLSLARRNKDNTKLLHIEQGNLLGAAQAAYQVGQYELLVELMQLLTVESQYLTAYGHTALFTACADDAIAAARKLGADYVSSLHYLLSKRGNMYYERGDLPRAVACYQEAGEIAHRLKWTSRHILALCVTSKVRSEMGETRTAQAGLDEAYRLAVATKDDAMLARVLENSCVLAYTQGDFERVRALSKQEVELAVRISDDRSRFNALYNWGSAEQYMGNFKASLPLLLQAHEIAQSMDVIRWRASSMHLLAMTYHELGDDDQAEHYVTQSAELFRQSGYTVKEQELEALKKEITAHKTLQTKKD